MRRQAARAATRAMSDGGSCGIARAWPFLRFALELVGGERLGGRCAALPRRSARGCRFDAVPAVSVRRRVRLLRAGAAARRPCAGCRLAHGGGGRRSSLARGAALDAGAIGGGGAFAASPAAASGGAVARRRCRRRPALSSRARRACRTRRPCRSRARLTWSGSSSCSRPIAIAPIVAAAASGHHQRSGRSDCGTADVDASVDCGPGADLAPRSGADRVVERGAAAPRARPRARPRRRAGRADRSGPASLTSNLPAPRGASRARSGCGSSRSRRRRRSASAISASSSPPS